MISFICWKWAHPTYRFQYTAKHVNVLARMIGRHYQNDHEVVCITDDPEGIDPDIRTIPLWDTYGDLENPSGSHFPSCYRRLYAWSDEFKLLVPNRFVSIDLDAVIVRDITDMIDDKQEDVVFWRRGHAGRINGSLWAHTPGTRTHIWENFDPEKSPNEQVRNKLQGSDQGWFMLNFPNSQCWLKEDGVYSWSLDLKANAAHLPDNARIVFFHGHPKPWDNDAVRRSPWVTRHWK